VRHTHARISSYKRQHELLRGSNVHVSRFRFLTAIRACRQQRDKIGGTFGVMSAAVKVMQHQQQAEKAGEDGNPEAQAEQLRLMLDAMWASNALDIQTTVSRVCHEVRFC
jgi:X-domain of DnaJ-containing